MDPNANASGLLVALAEGAADLAAASPGSAAFVSAVVYVLARRQS